MTLFVACNSAVRAGGGGIGYFSSWILDAPSSIMLIYLLNFSKAFLSGFRKPPRRERRDIFVKGTYISKLTTITVLNYAHPRDVVGTLLQSTFTDYTQCSLILVQSK